jgi:lysophospholipase L1-like esterase
VGDYPLSRSLTITSALVLGTLIALVSGSLHATDYVAFGDSITLSKGIDNEGTVFNFDEDNEGGYPGRLQDLLRDAGNKKDKVRNEGISGEPSDAALTSINSALRSGDDVMLLMFGTNDATAIAQGVGSVETTKRNLQSLVEKARKRGLSTIMATIIPRVPIAAWDRTNTITKSIMRAIRELQSANGRSLADPWEFFNRIPKNQLFKNYYASLPGLTDRVGHPNAAGYSLIAQTFADVILGIDTLEPLLGPFTPAGTIEFKEDDELKLVLYDHLTGIDRNETFFFVNGKEVDAAKVTSTGDRKKATLKLDLSGIEDCKLRLDVVSQDRIEDRKIKDGDVDFDCRVDGSDLVLFAFHFGTEKNDARFDRAADFDGDGEIDGKDLARLSKNFGKSSKK